MLKSWVFQPQIFYFLYVEKLNWIWSTGSGYTFSSSSGKLNSKYCGSYFPVYGVAYATGIIATVCGEPNLLQLEFFSLKFVVNNNSFKKNTDCIAPFYVGIRTDLTSSTIAANRNRGERECNIWSTVSRTLQSFKHWGGCSFKMMRFNFSFSSFRSLSWLPTDSLQCIKVKEKVIRTLKFETVTLW